MGCATRWVTVGWEPFGTCALAEARAARNPSGVRAAGGPARLSRHHLVWWRVTRADIGEAGAFVGGSQIELLPTTTQEACGAQVI